ncbi:RICIN domain-containing protein [Streptomyces sp. H27-H1]|uniref:RICIN domain-containing protein n=1 Tax=Streptomyces sp. H27-H1 TaxID=2996461 RepID=UPI002271F006|nr:RICIN domain-containing protein [Streptomyces sp. H27-H1]MCY0926818.1 RICIN domain-containing protein [Streptomyces sp. H27-H1]
MSARSRTMTAGALAATAAVLFGTLAAAPASAQPPSPTYTVAIGAKGAWGNPDDTPAATYIDKNGAFYYQSAHALYAANDPRKWTFYTGKDFDSAGRSSTLSDAVNPANPNDRNNDTTWRCNNSPTGREATYAPDTSHYAQKNYCDLMGVWVDPDTGDWYGLVHNEFTPRPFGDGLHYDAIDYAVSKDQGKTWSIKDHVLTSPYSTRRGDTSAFPHETYHYGNGDARLFVDTASGYFYVYYNSRVIPKGGVPGGWTSGSRAHVARAPMSGKMAPGSWQKWYDGAWSQPGTGGLESNMEPVDAGRSTGYTPVAHDYDPANAGTVQEQQAAGELPAKSDLLTMSVAYNAYLGLYVGEPEAVDQDAGEPQRFYVTDNLATQKWRLAGDSGGYRTGSWYRWMLDSVNKTGSTIVGKQFRSYCSFFCSEGSDGEYYDTVIDTSAPAAPLDPGKSYTIANGANRFLSQVQGSTATTSQASAGSSALRRWVFTPGGDGSYRIANASTGRLLGVDSKNNAGRAWAAKPTVTKAPAGGPTVGQQWFVVPNSTVDGAPTGTYRLVNRYSGLVIGMSATSGRLAETTPTREWTDTTGTSVGGARTAAEQTLTLSVAGPAAKAGSVAAESARAGGLDPLRLTGRKED